MTRFRRSRDYTIAARHLVSFLGFIVVPTLAAFLLSGFAFRREMVRLTTEQRSGALEQTADSVESGLQGLAITGAALINDRVIASASLAYAGTSSPDERYRLAVTLDSVFNRFFILSRQLGSFYLFFDGVESPYVCRNYAGTNFTLGELESFIAAGEERPGVLAIVNAVGARSAAPGAAPTVMLAVNPSPASAGETGVRSLFLSFVLADLTDFIDQKNDLSRNRGKYQSSSFLVGSDGSVLASSDAASVGRPFAEVKRDMGRQYVVMEKPVDTPLWTVAEAINIRSLTQRVDTLMLWFFAALALMALLSLRYNALFYKQIVNPLNEVVREMDTVAKGDFDTRVEPSEIPELNRLGHAFNLMVAEIDLLTSEIKEEQKERVKAEIEALRYQLNPHFLCNTLNSIRLMAKITRNEAIGKMTGALMAIVEDNLGRDDTVYSLERELKNLESYVYVMKVRYGDAFEFFADVDPSLLGLGVPSMILQPLVENAILHGVHGLPRTGSVTVAAARDGDSLRIDVRDNGFGMTPERIAGIFAGDSASDRGINRIGLYNVRRRIILLYGKEYDLSVSSYPDEGTVITLRLPILPAPEEDGGFGAVRRGNAEGDPS